jgi:hypothetical protein
MSKKQGLLKRRLRGIQKLKDALTYLGWSSIPMPGLADGEGVPGYIIGPKLHCAVIYDAAKTQLEANFEENKPKDAGVESDEKTEDSSV